MKPVLCIALNPALDVACNVEHVRPTHKLRTSGDTYYPGGGGVNVARVIAELGGEPELVYLSGGETGAALERLLEPLPITRRRVETGAMTRVSYTVHEESSGFEYRFVAEGHEVGPALLGEVVEMVRESKYDYVVGSGSLPPGLPSTAYVEIAQACAAAGSRFVLDTSGDALHHALYESEVFLVKPSIGELQRLSGVAGDERAAEGQAMQIIDRGCANYVAVSMGREGAMLVSADGATRLPAYHVPVRSAVGAGDSFVGAVVYALANDRPIERAFEWGVAAGASAVATQGTALCEHAHVADLLRQVQDATAAA